MCQKNGIPNAQIIPVPALGAVTSPYFVQLTVLQKLCHKTCAESTPVFTPQVSLTGVDEVEKGYFILKMHIEGIISYAPCCGGCCAFQQPLSQDFTVPLYVPAPDPVVTVETGAAVNGMVVSDCQKCAKMFKSEIPLTITVE